MSEPSGPQPPSKSLLGRQAEAIVAAWLSERGWRIAATNWRKGPGELDIVAVKGQLISFIEVKRVDAYGLESLSSSVGANKRRRIIETAKLFLVYHREFELMAQRFDLAAVRGDSVELYLESAFSEKA